MLSCFHQTLVSLLPATQRKETCPLFHPPNYICSRPRLFFASDLSPQGLELATLYCVIFCICRWSHNDSSEPVIIALLPPSRCVSWSSHELANLFDGTILPPLRFTQSSMVPFILTSWAGESPKDPKSVITDPEPSVQDPQPAD